MIDYKQLMINPSFLTLNMTFAKELQSDLNHIQVCGDFLQAWKNTKTFDGWNPALKKCYLLI